MAAPEPRQSLAVLGLTVTNPRGRSILSVERFSAHSGEAIGIRGPSGAGKSTFLYAICGLLPNACGKVQWGDTDLLALSQQDRTAFRRRSIGLVFQDFLLFEELNAVENAAICASYAQSGERHAIFRRANAMLQRLGVPVDRKRSVRSFSGGERQRIAVARALAHDPDVILADEPTASLDRHAADRLIDDLTALARESGKLLITVSHDARLHQRMDRMIDIVDGVLKDEGRTNV